MGATHGSVTPIAKTQTLQRYSPSDVLSTTPSTVSSSAALSGPSFIPFAYARTLPAPMKEPTFTEI